MSQGVGGGGAAVAALLPADPSAASGSLSELLGATGRRLGRQIRHRTRCTRGTALAPDARRGKSKVAQKVSSSTNVQLPGFPGGGIAFQSPSGSLRRRSAAGGARGTAGHHSPPTIAARRMHSLETGASSRSRADSHHHLRATGFPEARRHTTNSS